MKQLNSKRVFNAIALMMTLALSLPLFAQFNPQQEIFASDAAAGDEFGYAVDVSGDYAIVGAPFDDDAGTNSGSAYIYQRIGGVWTSQVKLPVPSAEAEANFGYSVAIDGDFAAVGAYRQDTFGNVNAGAVYVYVRNFGANTWTHSATLNASDLSSNDNFGTAVDIHDLSTIGIFGNQATVVVGAPGDDDGGSGSGSAYVFNQRLSFPSFTLSWFQDEKLTASDAANNDLFGTSVAITEGRIVVGAHLEDELGNSAGAAYVFDGSGSLWTETQKLLATDGQSSDFFGFDVDVDGDLIVVGAWGEDTAGSAAGAAYVYQLDSCTGQLGCATPNWSGIKLSTSNTATLDFVGYEVAVDGNVIVVASHNNDGASVGGGKFHTFIRSNQGLIQTEYFADDSLAGDNMGRGIAISGNTIIAGARLEDTNGVSSGSAYLFDLDPDGDGMPSAYEQATACCNPLSDESTLDQDADGATELQEYLSRTNFDEPDTDFDGDSDGIEIALGSDPRDILSRLDYDLLDDSSLNLTTVSNLGESVAVDGLVAVVGAPGAGVGGLAYVYERSAGTSRDWQHVQTIVGGDTQSGDRFGSSVAVYGNNIVVGAPEFGAGDDGKVYVFQKSGNNVIQQSTISSVLAGGQFGRTIVLNQLSLAVGAPLINQVRTYDLTNISFPQPSGVLDGTGSFGQSLAINTEYLAIGAPESDSTGVNSGAAFVYKLDDEGDVAANFDPFILLPRDLASDEDFGASIAIDAEFIAVGAPSAGIDGVLTGNGPGAVYVFEEEPFGWSQTNILRDASPTSATDQFGQTVAADENVIAVGSPGRMSGVFVAGGLTVFQRTSGCCYRYDFSLPSSNTGTLPSAIAISEGAMLLGNSALTGSVFFATLDPDQDGLKSGFELNWGFDPYADNGDASADPDGDGLDNLAEQAVATSILSDDTDGDGFSDFVEVSGAGSDPLDAASTPLLIRLQSPGVEIGDAYGAAVAIDGDYAVIAAPFEQDGVQVENQGAVYFFERVNGIWEQVLKIEGFDSSFTGNSVALDGDIAVIGAPGDRRVFVYVRGATSWSLEETINNLADGFGESVAVHDDMLVVGAPEEFNFQNGAGAAFVYDRDPIMGSWTQAVELLSTNANQSDYATDGGFGSAVDIVESQGVDYAIVGASGLDRAFIFRRLSSTWSLQQTLDENVGLSFGESVSIGDEVAVVGAPLDFNGAIADGSVYVYELQTSWTLQTVLGSPSPLNGGGFGFDVDLSNSHLVISEIGDGAISSGAVYRYNLPNYAFDEIITGAAADTWFGYSISASGDSVLIGAPTLGLLGEGVAYFFFDDSDFDLIGESVDNCPLVANVNQENADVDALGDVCDLDDEAIPLAGAGFLDIDNLDALTGSSSVFALDISPFSTIDFVPDVGYEGPWPLCFDIAGKPEWLNFNPISGRIQGTPNNQDFGSSGITITARESMVVPDPQSTDCAAIAVSSGQQFSAQLITLNVLDTFAPTISSVPANGGVSQTSVLVTMTCSEAVGSGCASIEVVLDTTLPLEEEPTTVLALDGNNQAQFDVTTSGRLRFRSVDVAGNKSPISEIDFVIDAVDPIINVSAPSQAFVTTTQVQFVGAADDVGTGVDSIVLDISDTPVGGSNNLYQVVATHKTVGSCTGDAGDGVSPVVIAAPCWEASYTPVSTDGAITYSVMVTDFVANSQNVAGGFENYSGPAQVTELELTNITSNSLPFDGDVDLTYTFKVIGNAVADLSAEPIVVTITPPLGSLTSPTVLNLNPNSAGQLTLTGLGSSDYTPAPAFRFNEKGVWAIQASYAGSVRYTASSSLVEDVVVGTSAGYAVLIQGQASTSNNDGLESYNRTLNRVYDTLKRRNFDDQNIFYFNFDGTQDVNGDGVPDNIFQDGKGIDADIDIVGKAGIQAQIQNLFFLMNSNPAPLYVVMVDHGRRVNGGTPTASSEFLIGNAADGDTTITPVELDGWLDTLESNLNTEAAQEPRVIINGSCYSGGFIEPLTGVNGVATQTSGGDPLSQRIVITSSAPNEVSYKGPLENAADADSRAGEYFIESLFDALDGGVTLLDAFQIATADTEAFTRADDSGLINGLFLDDAVQHPLVCDNGDGIGTNAIQSALLDDALEAEPGFSGFGDGNRIAKLYLGNASQSAINSLLVPAAVSVATPTIYLPPGTAQPADSEVLLVIEPNDNNETGAAFVEVRAPQEVLPGGDVGGTFPTEQLEAAQLSRLGLDAPGINGCPSVPATWCRTEGSFTDPGKYEVFHYVIDSETNALSEGVRTLVYKNKGSNDFAATNEPAVFDLSTPVNGAAVDGSVAILSWTPSSDVDGLTYTVRVCENEADIDNPADPANCVDYVEVPRNFLGITGLRDFNEQNQLVVYSWGVDAVDSFGTVTKAGSAVAPPRSTWTFTADSGSAPTGLLRGYVQSRSNPALFLDNASVAGVSSTFSDNDGFYTLQLDEGIASIIASRSGYVDESQLAVIQSGLVVDLNFALDEDVPDTDSDGVDDNSDNCVNDPNPGQENFDGDAEGDACDSDDDNDQISDVDENSVVLDPTDLLDPFNAADALIDSDGDGLSNRDEINVHGTEIFTADTDGDGVSDGDEVNASTDPNDSSSTPEIINVPIGYGYPVLLLISCLFIAMRRRCCLS